MAKFAYDTKYESIFSSLFGASTLQDLRKLAKPFIIKFHPDKGGDAEAMVALNAIIAKVTEGIVGGARARATRDAQDTASARGYKYSHKDYSSYDAMLRDIIAWVVSLNDDVHAELCGTWIFVKGDTKPLRQEFKQRGFLWSNNKTAWYWNGNAKKRYYGKAKSMEYIRNKYGSKEVK